jgi:hypothetical protein
MDDIYHYTRNTIAQESTLILLAKSEGIQTTLKDVETFMSSRTEVQQFKESKQTKQSNGQVVRYSSFSRLQLEIFVLK